MAVSGRVSGSAEWQRRWAYYLLVCGKGGRGGAGGDTAATDKTDEKGMVGMEKWSYLANRVGPRELSPPRPSPTGWVFPGCTGANLGRNIAILVAGGAIVKISVLTGQNGTSFCPVGVLGDDWRCP